MIQATVREIVFESTVFDVYSCNANDDILLELFERQVRPTIESVEEIYSWLRGHDIYYTVSYNKSFRRSLWGHLSGRLNFESLKRLFPVSLKAEAKYNSDDEIFNDISEIFSNSDYGVLCYSKGRNYSGAE